ncbi:hypothetical protein ACFL3P_01280 [Pseudomonadota bacterium]
MGNITRNDFVSPVTLEGLAYSSVGVIDEHAVKELSNLNHLMLS